MKPLTLVELKSLTQVLRPLIGGQLQEVHPNDRGLALGFYNQKMSYLILDLSNQNPGLYRFDQINFWKKSPKPKPVSLFLNSHAKNLILRDIELCEEYGRVVKLYLSSSEKKCELQCILIPKQANLIVQSEVIGVEGSQKKISWVKPREIPENPIVLDASPPREVSDLHEDWLGTLSRKSNSSLDPVIQWEKTRDQQVKKKKKALLEIEKNYEAEQHLQWQAVGEALKLKSLEEVEKDFPIGGPWVDSRLSLRENRERAFSKAKQIRQKKEGQKLRIEILKEEIAQLEVSVFEKKTELKLAKMKAQDLLRTSQSAGRKKKLSGGAEVYIGKTAKDNLKILRAARPWDFWLHLRDYPGAHGIIHRGKDQSISEDEIREVARWVAEESLSKKSLALGQRLNVALVECRFVKPIKGDRHGRVHFHSERNLVIKW